MSADELSGALSHTLSDALSEDNVDEIFDHLVISDVASARATCIPWRDAASAHYATRRTHHVPRNGIHDVLPRLRHGDTLLFAPGLHEIHGPLRIDVSVRIIGDETVLYGTHHTVVQFSAERVHCYDVSFCRLGDELGYPNAVLYVEFGHVTFESCRITCGGAQQSAERAMAQRGYPHPVVVKTIHPQSGVWVGSGGRVEMRRCDVSRCMGPGLKLRRGQAVVECSTFAHSAWGANVVCNGGELEMRESVVCGANDNGVVSWKNARLTLVSNEISDNWGSPIVLNEEHDNVEIRGNHFVRNRDIPRVPPTKLRDIVTHNFWL